MGFRKTIFVIPFFFLSVLTYGNSLTVCPDCQITSIKAALEQAESRDSIIVKKGIYKEGNILIEKAVELFGEDYPVVDGEYQTEIFSIFSDSVRISGFQIQNVGFSYTQDRAAIKVNKSQGCVIDNNKVLDSFVGIYFAHSGNSIIRDNVLIGKAEEEYS